MKELKWTVKKDGKEIGELELCNPQIFSFDVLEGKCKDFYILLEITKMSEELKNELDKFIEERKRKAVLKNIRWGKRLNQERRTAWSDAPVKFHYVSLSIDLHTDQEDEYEIMFSVCDGIYGDELSIEDRMLVDVSEHVPELKEILRKQLLENFNQFF